MVIEIVLVIVEDELRNFVNSVLIACSLTDKNNCQFDFSVFLPIFRISWRINGPTRENGIGVLSKLSCHCVVLCYVVLL